MSATLNTITPKQKLLAKIEKNGGVKANRKVLEDLKDFVSKEMPSINAEKVRAKAWK